LHFFSYSSLSYLISSQVQWRKIQQYGTVHGYLSWKETWWHLIKWKIHNFVMHLIAGDWFESLVPIWLNCLLKILSSDSIDNHSIMSQTDPNSINYKSNISIHNQLRVYLALNWKPWIRVSCPQWISLPRDNRIS